MKKRKKMYRLHTSNQITYEDLGTIEDSIFEDVYRGADWTLYKVVKSVSGTIGNSEGKENEKDDYGLNVLSFLGKRGRGKTSAMLSFLFCMNKLRQYEWSKFYQWKDNGHFVALPYIDAAMLAENEYIVDVILAEMWDVFERDTEKLNMGRWESEDLRDMEQKIKKAFIDVRKAYLNLKERERDAGNGLDERDMPIPSQLHELAASLNLRNEMKRLVRDFLAWSHSGKSGSKDFLVIPIDDIDMSGKKAQSILEQLRRFLRIPQVIILLTADIERLQLACESNYTQIYTDERDRRHFVNEYLEKVLPYNMRMYMPEVKEEYGEIPIDLPEYEKLSLICKNEKDMILEFIAREYGILFNGTRKQRHFLQNQSMRSMANYFEQLARVKGMNSCDWLKIDLQERLMERVQNTEQRRFVSELLSRDYENINTTVINFINRILQGQRKVVVHDQSLGQVLYGCHLLEVESADNVDFVNCIIMLYSVIIRQTDGNLRDRVIGNSLFGEWEYMSAALQNTAPSDMCQGFDTRGELKIEIPIDAELWMEAEDLLNSEENRDSLKAWVYSLLFVTVIPLTSQGTSFNVTCKEIHDKVDVDSDVILRTELTLQPVATARKNYFSCLFLDQGTSYNDVRSWLIAVYADVDGWLKRENGYKEYVEELNGKAEKFADDLLAEMRLAKLKEKSEPSYVVPVQNVEALYSIGQALDEITKPTRNSEGEVFEAVRLRYQKIKEVLRDIDAYNMRFGKTLRTQYEQNFSNGLQTKLMLEEESMSDDLREAFVKKLGKVFMETTSTTVAVTNRG